MKDRSSAPLHCPTITHPEVVEKIIQVRQYYCFGPLKIERYRSLPTSTSLVKGGMGCGQVVA